MDTYIFCRQVPLASRNPFMNPKLRTPGLYIDLSNLFSAEEIFFKEKRRDTKPLILPKLIFYFLPAKDLFS